MSKARYTPGPWEIKNQSDGVFLICTSKPSISPIAEGVFKRDAYLMAAAPDLLEALEVMVESMEMGNFGKRYALDVARKAIAKAKGE